MTNRWLVAYPIFLVMLLTASNAKAVEPLSSGAPAEHSSHFTGDQDMGFCVSSIQGLVDSAIATNEGLAATNVSADQSLAGGAALLLRDYARAR